MKYIVVEDEPLALERVTEFAGRIPDLQLDATFENAVDAIAHLTSHPVDLIFLDINIGEISGLQFLEILKPDCAVIILTAYQEYALKGFEMNVTDYLLKPFIFERFCKAVERARALQTNLPHKEFIFVRTQHRFERIMLADLIYIEGARDYRRIRTTKRSFMTLETFGEFEKKLPPLRFMRIHKSYLVALDKIEALERDMIQICGRILPVSETYRKTLMNRIR